MESGLKYSKYCLVNKGGIHLDLFKFFSKDKNNSKTVAKERLKLVLINDRADISPKYLDMIKSDITRILSEYMVIDEEGLDIKLTRSIRESDDKPMPSLVANIPIIKMKNKNVG